MTQPYVLYKKQTLDSETQISLRLKNGKIYIMQTLNQKKAEVTILITHKINFKTKMVNRGKKEQFIILKGSIHVEHLTIIKIYT